MHNSKIQRKSVKQIYFNEKSLNHSRKTKKLPETSNLCTLRRQVSKTPI